MCVLEPRCLRAISHLTLFVLLGCAGTASGAVESDKSEAMVVLSDAELGGYPSCLNCLNVVSWLAEDAAGMTTNPEVLDLAFENLKDGTQEQRGVDALSTVGSTSLRRTPHPNGGGVSCANIHFPEDDYDDGGEFNVLGYWSERPTNNEDFGLLIHDSIDDVCIGAAVCDTGRRVVNLRDDPSAEVFREVTCAVPLVAP